VRGVRPGRGDEVPRARATTTVGVRRELSRSRMGPGAGHTVVVSFWSVSAFVRELIELYFLY